MGMLDDALAGAMAERARAAETKRVADEQRTKQHAASLARIDELAKEFATLAATHGIPFDQMPEGWERGWRVRIWGASGEYQVQYGVVAVSWSGQWVWAERDQARPTDVPPVEDVERCFQRRVWLALDGS